MVSLHVFGRLKEGVTLAQAEADLKIITNDLAAGYPEDKGNGVRLESILQAEVSDYAGRLSWVLGAAAAFLLLLSSTNVATLLVSRASDRSNAI